MTDQELVALVTEHVSALRARGLEVVIVASWIGPPQHSVVVGSLPRSLEIDVLRRTADQLEGKEKQRGAVAN